MKLVRPGNEKVISCGAVAGADTTLHNVSLTLALYHEMKLDDIGVIMQWDGNAGSHRGKVGKILQSWDFMLVCGQYFLVFIPYIIVKYFLFHSSCLFLCHVAKRLVCRGVIVAGIVVMVHSVTSNG